MAPSRHREKFRAMASDDQCLKSLVRFVTAGRRPVDLTRQFAFHDSESLIVASGIAYRRVGLTEKAYQFASDVIAKFEDYSSAAATDTLQRAFERGGC